MSNLAMALRGDETPGDLLKKLVQLRFIGRSLVSLRHALRSVPKPLNEAQREASLWLRTMEIELGSFLHHLCNAMVKETPLADVREAIGANRALWDEARSSMGNTNSAARLLVLMGEENSGTREDYGWGADYRPLNWCLTMTMMHATRTSPKADQAIHDAANKFFGGAFGEWKERPLMERLVGRVV